MGVSLDVSSATFHSISVNSSFENSSISCPSSKSEDASSSVNLEFDSYFETFEFDEPSYQQFVQDITDSLQNFPKCLAIENSAGMHRASSMISMREDLYEIYAQLTSDFVALSDEPLKETDLNEFSVSTLADISELDSAMFTDILNRSACERKACVSKQATRESKDSVLVEIPVDGNADLKIEEQLFKHHENKDSGNNGKYSCVFLRFRAALTSLVIFFLLSILIVF